MQRLCLLFLFCLVACQPVPAKVQLQIVRVGGLDLTVANNAQTFPVSLTEGTLTFEAVNLFDAEGFAETPLVPVDSVFDFVTTPTFVTSSVFVIPATYEQVHVIPKANALTAQLTFRVTLSNASVIQGQLTLFSSIADEEEVNAVFSIADNENKLITLAFDPAKLLDNIDFDVLGSNGDFVIQANTNDPAIDAALATINDNLFSTFALVSVQ